MIGQDTANRTISWIVLYLQSNVIVLDKFSFVVSTIMDQGGKKKRAVSTGSG